MTERVAWVTGAGGGIGTAIAIRLAERGFRVIATDQDGLRALGTANRCGGVHLRADAGSPNDNRAAVDLARQRFDRLDVAVLNAGVPGGGFTDFSPKRYRRGMRTNLDGVVHGIVACLPMLRRSRGRVLVMGSLAGLTGSADPFYAAAKHALVGLVRSAAPELADIGVGIDLLCPGLVDTRLLAGRRDAVRRAGLAVARPAEIADACETVLDAQGTGRVWVVQAGQPARTVDPIVIAPAVEPGAAE